MLSQKDKAVPTSRSLVTLLTRVDYCPISAALLVDSKVQAMRVLTYTSLFPNGADPEHGVFIYQRMAHFARRPGNTVNVVAPVPWAPPVITRSERRLFRSIPHEEQIGDLTVLHPRYPLLPGVSMPVHGLLMFLGSQRVVRRLHSRVRFDVVDAHYVYPDGLAAALAARMLRLPFVVSARGTDMNLFPRFRLIRPQISWTLRQAAGGIGVCTPLRNAMIECGLLDNHATVIGNGIDLDRFEPIARPVARKHLGIPLDARVLLAVGTLIPRKGMHLLIEAFARVRRTRPETLLYIVGEGAQRPELEGLIAAHQATGSVFLPGKVPNTELRWWYSAADVSCLVSSREGWPNVLLESLACGTPVVATSVWGVPEVICSPALGVLVERDVSSIAAGLEKALTTTWDRDALIGRARSRTWGVVADELEQFLDKRLAPGGA